MHRSYTTDARAALAAILLAVAAVPAAAQDSTARPAPIQDNSFLIEEAYNQEPRVVQHISTFARPTRGASWAFSFTQEWPAPSQRHQLSYTVPVLQPDATGGSGGIGDVALNYRYQLRGMHEERVAVAPRLTAILPTGDAGKGTGGGGTAVQLNLPVSVELSERLVTHLNAGATVTPRARAGDGPAVSTTSYALGESVIWLVHQRVNLMVEALWQSNESPDAAGGTSRDSELLVSPGVRWSYDLANGTQIVPGLALTLPSRGGTPSLFLYFSVEHPF